MQCLKTNAGTIMDDEGRSILGNGPRMRGNDPQKRALTGPWRVASGWTAGRWPLDDPTAFYKNVLHGPPNLSLTPLPARYGRTGSTGQPRAKLAAGRWGVTEDAISIGGVSLTDPRTYSERMPYEAFRKLRERAPVAWHPYKDGPGFLALTGYDEVLAVSRDSATWSSETDGVHFDVPGPDDLADVRGVMMLTMDPPRHTALRALVNKGFTPRQVAKLNEHIADMARDVVDSVIERGQCDFVNDVAGALPSYVIAELLGIPLEDGYRLYELTEITNSGVPGDANPRATEAGIQIFAYAAELAARKRAQPGDDIATSLLHAEVDGQRLTDMEFNFFFMLLLIAGGDTTRNLVAGGMCVLIEHPEERAKLEADPSLLPTAVEEMLRYVSPVIAFVRTATKDTELRGVRVKKGDRAAMFYPRPTETRPTSPIPTVST